MTFRKTIFWIHLLAGLMAGISIFIMCFTGTVLAFEKQIVAFAERDVRQVTPPANEVRLPLTELQQKVKAAHPDAKPTAIVVSKDPAEAVVFQLGRAGALYANPYTGEVAQPVSSRMHDFMHLMEDWHRWLAIGGEGRAIGKAINGACNVAFLVLAITGLYIWWPRRWSVAGLKRILWFVRTKNSKARDWNWHNVIGFWSAPILIVLTLTAMPISYRWASNLIYTSVGETPPVRRGRGAPPPQVELPAVAPGSRPLSLDAMLNSAQQQLPDWSQISLRLPSTSSRGSQRAEKSNAPAPISVSVKSPGNWPRTASTSLTLNPYTAGSIKTEKFSDQSTGRKIRSWSRFLHTGEALGLGGQFFAGLASLGGCFLVYTGFALSWRRFIRWRRA